MNKLLMFFALTGLTGTSVAQRIFNVDPFGPPAFANVNVNGFPAQPPPPPVNNDRRPPPLSLSNDIRRRPLAPADGPEVPRDLRYPEQQFIAVPLDKVLVISQQDTPKFLAALLQQQQQKPEPVQQRLIVVRKIENTQQFDSPLLNNKDGSFMFKNNFPTRILNPNNIFREQQNVAPVHVVMNDDAVPFRLDLQQRKDNAQAVPVVVSNYYVNFKHQFDRVDPRNPNSEWRWSQLGNYIANGGKFVQDALSSVELSAIPFVNNTDDPLRSMRGGGGGGNNQRLAALTNHEALLVNKRNILLAPDQQVSARFSFACKVYNVTDQPYPLNVVSNAEDDPTLANCGISLATRGDTSLVFSIVATNNGIWAVYERNRYLLAVNSNKQDRVFTIFHHLAKRTSSDEIIDASITLDRSENRVDYKLNGESVWNITRLGTLPPNEPGIKQHLSERPDLQQIIDPTKVLVTFGLTKYMDEYDPNNSAEFGLRKQRLVKQQDYYDPSAKFYDNDAKLELNQFGQGAKMTLYDAVIQIKQLQPPRPVVVVRQDVSYRV